MNEGICGDVDQNDKFWPKFINTLDRFIQGIQKPNREVTTNFVMMCILYYQQYMYKLLVVQKFHGALL